MFTSCPSRETWMCPSFVGTVLPLAVVWVAGTTVPPITLTTSVTSDPVTWLGVGWVIWIRTGDAGWLVADDGVDDGFDPPQPVAVTAMASTAGRARRVILAVIV